MIFPATFAHQFAAVWPGAPEWLSAKVFICGGAAAVLLLVALMLRGIQKLIILAIAAALVAGTFFFARDVWENRAKMLPPDVVRQLDDLADRTVRSPRAQSARAEIEREWSELSRSVRERVAGGGERSRKAVRDQLAAKEAALRAAGKKDAAEEIARLRAQSETQ